MMSADTSQAIVVYDQALVAYHKAESLYNKLRKQAENTASKLREIADEIQKLETKLRKGRFAYSSVGIFGGVMTIAGIAGAPFTFGGSLSLTAVGATTCIGSGAANIGHTWLNSSQVKKKCEDASELLNDSQQNFQQLKNELKHLHNLQSQLSTLLGVANISSSTIGSIASIAGEAFALMLARNLPNMARSSKALSFMFGFGGFNFGVQFSAQSVGKGITTTIGKQAASNVARNSLRVIGGAVVGAGILLDIMSLIDNKKALDTNKLCEQTSKLRIAADQIETQMRQFETVFYDDQSNPKQHDVLNFNEPKLGKATDQMEMDGNRKFKTVFNDRSYSKEYDVSDFYS